MRKFAVVLAGGRGERFWPLSQPHCPKQFLTIFDDKPLLTQTLERIGGYFKKSERLLIIPSELRALTRKYAGKENVVVEPVRRNTAPAICLAGMALRKKYGGGIMHVMPADHLIRPKSAFISALKYGQKLAENGYVVTYGIRPARPETGYGYVKLGRRLGVSRNNRAYRGAGFTEKPSAVRARQYIKSGRYLWNSGIFTFCIKTILEEMKSFVPQVYRGVEKYVAGGVVNNFGRVPDISIDYGVMEKSRRLCVVEGHFNWDDVGSWLALDRYFTRDKKKNIVIGDARGLDVKDSIVFSRNIPLRVDGVKGLIVIASPDGVLVCRKDRAQDLKKLLK
ncbi:MAG: mannose-1-phosphate guanylyltransferase [candidate division WOR-3 bacterium]|nr:MAG: mannose-1-phosphate guanylyltransferase [candidate division WOR-3 bacterium]